MKTKTIWVLLIIIAAFFSVLYMLTLVKVTRMEDAGALTYLFFLLMSFSAWPTALVIVSAIDSIIEKRKRKGQHS